MPNNGTIAVWCVPRAGGAGTTTEVHFNYWRIAGDKDFVRTTKNAAADFVEVGLLITDIGEVGSINLFLPMAVVGSTIEDCAVYLSQAKFAQGIFNEVLQVTAPVPGGPRSITLHGQSGAVFCRVHCFAQGTVGLDMSELSVQQRHSGTVLTITPAAINEARQHATPLAPTYFRLRVQLKAGEENPFVKVIKPTDRRFQSGYEEIEYIDFRMNEARTLPTPIEQAMRNDNALGGAVTIKLVAFLTAVPVHSEMTVSNTPSHKMRLLEQSWKEYVACGIPDGMVVYHWRRDAEPLKPINDFSAFVKLQTRRTSRRILAIYLLIAFLIGLVGNWTASGIQAWTGAYWPQPKMENPATSLVPPPPANALPAPQNALPVPVRDGASSDHKPATDMAVSGNGAAKSQFVRPGAAVPAPLGGPSRRATNAIGN